jgi:pheromone shutdown protein TraB
VTVVVRHACASPAAAERLRRAVVADNPEHVAVTVDGSELVVRVAAGPPASVRATLDDLLACLAAAEAAGVPEPGAPSVEP